MLSPCTAAWLTLLSCTTLCPLLAPCRRYETIWLPILAKALVQGKAHELLPPIDVLFISYLHRIAPQAYYKDTSLIKSRALAARVKLLMPTLPPWQLNMPALWLRTHQEQVCLTGQERISLTFFIGLGSVLKQSAATSAPSA